MAVALADQLEHKLYERSCMGLLSSQNIYVWFPVKVELGMCRCIQCMCTCIYKNNTYNSICYSVYFALTSAYM